MFYFLISLASHHFNYCLLTAALETRTALANTSLQIKPALLNKVKQIIKFSAELFKLEYPGPTGF